MKTGHLKNQAPFERSRPTNRDNLHNNWLIRALFLIALLAGLFVGMESLSFAHEFEDGHVERSIDVIIRGRKLEMRYAFGLSDETIVAWLVKEDALEPAEATRFRKLISDYENASASKTKQLNGQTRGEDQVVADKPEPVAFQTELSSLLTKKLSQRVSKKFTLTANEKQMDFVVAKATASPRHHVAMELVLQATLPMEQAVHLSFVDRNFLDAVSGLSEDESRTPKRPNSEAEPQIIGKKKAISALSTQFEYSGNIRKACRVKGNAVQLSSNSVPVLTRAKPIDVGEMGLEERIEAGTIVTKIAFAEGSGQ